MFKGSVKITAIKNIVTVIGIILIISSGCKKEDEITTDHSAKLSFSEDSIIFDTVFTSLGSVTKRFKVYNKNDKAIEISSISLAGGGNSPYRINIDGQAGTRINNFTLLAHDSFYIFVEVTVDPNNDNSPFIVKDSIVFMTNDNFQDIKLVAWGQNAHYFRNEVLSCNEVWTNDLPYVIFDSVLVDYGCSLTIEDGVRIHSNNKSYILVGGTLVINGTTVDPVVLKGLRKEEYYKDKPGQWGGIRFLPGSSDNKLTNVQIRNATIGIEVDSNSINPPEPNLLMENVKIENMSAVGILGYTAHIVCINCLVDNCCQYLVVGDLGGTYEFYHTTFAHSNCICSSQDPALVFSNTDYVIGKDTLAINDINLTILNSIIWGNNDDELFFVDNGLGNLYATIDHVLIKSTDNQYNNFGNILNKDPKFVAPCSYSYELDTLSPAMNKGRNDLNITTDINGNIRDANPDLGAFERME